MEMTTRRATVGGIKYTTVHIHAPKTANPYKDINYIGHLSDEAAERATRDYLRGEPSTVPLEVGPAYYNAPGALMVS